MKTIRILSPRSSSSCFVIPALHAADYRVWPTSPGAVG